MRRLSTDSSQKSSRKLSPGWVAWLVTVGLLATAAIGTLPLASAKGWLISNDEPTITNLPIDELQPGAGKAGLIGPDIFDESKPASADAIKAAIEAVGPGEGTISAAAGDLNGDGLSYSKNSERALTPASTMKLMTSIGSLYKYSADARFTTSVIFDGATVTLKGGGDPLLASSPDSHPYAKEIDLPNLSDLAADTAAGLKQRGATRVKLAFDDSLFSGPSWQPSWDDSYHQWVSPVSALAVDLGKPKEHSDQADPAMSAALIFADQLRANGIDVGDDISRAEQPTGEAVASVQSVPLFNILERMNVHSDNYLAEVLFRQIALASGQPGSFEGGVSAQTTNLNELGLWSDGQAIHDGSGLSEDNKIAAGNLVKGLQIAQHNPKIRPLLEALPAAASTGTMAIRFADEASTAGRGVVRAKTGSLDRVSALAGYAPTRDGSLVAFALIGNDLPEDQDPRGWFDHVASSLAACNCAAG